MYLHWGLCMQHRYARKCYSTYKSHVFIHIIKKSLQMLVTNSKLKCRLILQV